MLSPIFMGDLYLHIALLLRLQLLISSIGSPILSPFPQLTSSAKIIRDYTCSYDLKLIPPEHSIPSHLARTHPQGSINLLT